MENVRGMSKKWEEIKENFETYLNANQKESYQFSSHLLYAEDFGVPQHRERFIVVGNRLGINPEAVFDEIFKSKQKPFVLKNALEGLPKLGTKKSKVKIMSKILILVLRNVILNTQKMISITL